MGIPLDPPFKKGGQPKAGSYLDPPFKKGGQPKAGLCFVPSSLGRKALLKAPEILQPGHKKTQ